MDGQQLEAYTRAVLTTFKSALEEGQFHNHSYALYRAFGLVESACADLYKLNEAPSGSEADDIQRRLQAVVSFVNKTIDALEKLGIQKTRLRRHDPPHPWREDYYDHIANLMFEVIHHAASVKTRHFVSWSVQHNTVWSQFFSHHDSKTRDIILFKLRRLLYEEIRRLGTAPNFLNAAFFGFLLNVLGVKLGQKERYSRGEYQLAKIVISWARKKYLWLAQYRPKVAAAVLMGTISFDAEHKRLIKTYIEGLNTVAPTDTLDLDAPADPVQEEKGA